MASKKKRRPTSRKKTRKNATVIIDNKGGSSWRREFAALLYGVAALFLLLSIVSHQLSVRVVAGGVVESAYNLMGPVGHAVATLMVGFMGWCAILPAVWLGVLAVVCWRMREPLKGKEKKAVEDTKGPLVWVLPGFLGVLFGVCTLAALFWGSSAGGVIGEAVSGRLVRMVGGVGAALATAAGVLVFLALATRSSMWFVGQLLLKWVLVGAIFVLLTVPTVVLRIFFWAAGFLTGGIGSLLRRLWPFKDSEDTEELPPPRRHSSFAPLDQELEEDEEEEDDDDDDLEEEEECEEEDDDYVVVVKRRSQQGKISEKEIQKAIKAAQRRNSHAYEDDPSWSDYSAPSVTLLTRSEAAIATEDDEELRIKSKVIESKLRDFNILGRVTEVHPGPVITLFEFEPAAGVKVGRIAALQDDLAMGLRASSIRIVAPIPRKGTVGIEVPNRHRDVVRLRDVLESPAYINAESTLSIPIGKDTYGDPVVTDISQMPHLLIAGATGTGKSVFINALLLSLLYRATPAELGLILIDPKILELSIYEGIPHLRVPVVTQAKQAKAVFEWAINEMERRYRVMQRFEVRSIDGYNAMVAGEPEDKLESGAARRLDDSVILLREGDILQSGTDEGVVDGDVDHMPPGAQRLRPLPKIVIVVDELADLMLSVGRDIEDLITRLAQKARAAGIHLIMATQRPSVDVITGLIKANFPARISFRVSSRVDSRTILDSMGADKLLGRGDMLMMIPGAEALRRVHGAYVSDAEVRGVVGALKQNSPPHYDQRIVDACERALEEEKASTSGAAGVDDSEYDSFYDRAVELVVQKGQASTSMIQRAFRIGYNRAARIIDMMESEGIVGPMDGVKPRQVLLPNHEESSADL